MPAAANSFSASSSSRLSLILFPPPERLALRSSTFTCTSPAVGCGIVNSMLLMGSPKILQPSGT